MLEFITRYLRGSGFTRKWKESVSFTPDQSYYYKPYTSRRGRLTKEEFGIPFSSPWIFKIRRENIYDRFCKWIGLVRESQLNDAELNERCFLVSDQDSLWQRLTDPAALNAIRQMQALSGFVFIACDGDSIYCGIKPSDLYPSNKGMVIPALQRMAECIKRIPAPIANKGWARKWTRAAFFEISAMALAIAALILLVIAHSQIFLQMLDHFQYLLDWMPGAVTVAIILALTAAWMVGGSSRAGQTLAVCLGCLLFAIPALTEGTVAMYNRYGGGQTEWTAHSAITGHYISKSRRRGSLYYTTFTLPDGSSHKVQLPRKEYDRTVARSSVDLRISSGAMGYPWIKSITPRP